ncbi:GntR family transcriptional regulator [Oceanobacillus profundus]|uniref:GntR family transcriptional regulator n=1 Tax=Oceanobacillus profundus TaxID=372463 RepID=UPI00203D9595|nr:GntR family transcriptional regulator [Oceanobacillus profundus]MCM3399949.1 GntR family transcriptional regulator [Oceanobacillus profundus]
MSLEENSAIPLHRQIRQYLENKIISGEWEPGYKIPTEKQLSSLFKVSNITVKRAVLDLVNNGKLYRKSGKGTFVNKHDKTDLSRLVSIHNKFEDEKPYPHKTLSFKKIVGNTELIKNLQIDKNEEIYYISRIKLEEEKPVIIENSWIPAALTPDLTEEEIENKLLYNLFSKKYGLKLDTAKVFISTKTADKSEAALLNIPIGEQLLVLDRYTKAEDDYIVEYSRFKAVFKDAKYFLEINL